MMKLKEKEEAILFALKSMDYLTVRQIAAMFDLKKDNTYRIVRKLSPYLSVFRDGISHENVYYLNRDGRDFAGSEKIRKKLTTAQHYIMRNDLYLFLNRPEKWQNEVRIRYVYDKANPKSRKITVVADAHFVYENQHHIIEIDNEQRMSENKTKVEKYRRLIEKNVFRGQPKLIWVTTSTYRRESLLEMCEGISTYVYLRSDLI